MQLEQEVVGRQTHKYYFDNIDLLRAFAALSVVVYHVIEILGWKTFPTNWPFVWFRFGWMGVDIFFVISGFVITLSAFNRLEKKGEKNFFFSFMKRRILRIVPLHYLTMLVFIVFIVPNLLFYNLMNNLFTHMLFIHNWFFSYHGSINGANWSLGDEMQFYFLIALTAKWLKKINWFYLLITVFCISFLWRAGAIYFVDINQERGTFKLFIASTQLPGMLDEFGVGMLLARLIMTDFGQKIISGQKYIILAISIVAVILVYTEMSIFVRYDTFWNYPLMVIFFRGAFAISVGAVILLLCSINVPRLLKSLMLPLYFLGTISYGIYLWHLPVLLSIKRIEGLPNNIALITIIIVTITFASGSWYFYERHFLVKK